MKTYIVLCFAAALLLFFIFVFQQGNDIRHVECATGCWCTWESKNRTCVTLTCGDKSFQLPSFYWLKKVHSIHVSKKSKITHILPLIHARYLRNVEIENDSKLICFQIYQLHLHLKNLKFKKNTCEKNKAKKPPSKKKVRWIWEIEHEEKYAETK